MFNETSAIGVLILAAIFLKKPLTGRRVVAVIVAMSGAALAVL